MEKPADMNAFIADTYAWIDRLLADCRALRLGGAATPPPEEVPQPIRRRRKRRTRPAPADMPATAPAPASDLGEARGRSGRDGGTHTINPNVIGGGARLPRPFENPTPHDIAVGLEE